MKQITASILSAVLFLSPLTSWAGQTIDAAALGGGAAKAPIEAAPAQAPAVSATNLDAARDAEPVLPAAAVAADPTAAEKIEAAEEAPRLVDQVRAGVSDEKGGVSPEGLDKLYTGGDSKADGASSAAPFSPARPVKILLISDDPSGGHRAAAKAVAEALNKMPNVTAKAMEFHDLSWPIRKRWRELVMKIRLAMYKPVVRFLFRLSKNPGPLLKAFWEMHNQLSPISLGRVRRMVADEQPDIILSTHMGTNALTRIWARQGVFRAPVYALVTDYLSHYVWVAKNVDRYFVASEGVKKDLVSYGVAAEKITVSGIPISPKILASQGKQQEELKKSLGLQPDKPAILLMGGSQGELEYASILQALEKLGADAQAVVFCGINKALQKKMEALAPTLKFPVIVKGFQTNMPDWYQAADLIITKPGGLTVSETMAVKKPMVLASPLAGMEEVQAERLEQAGVALYGRTPEQAAEFAQKILTDPSVKNKLQESVESFGRPNAAATIADILARSAPDGLRLPAYSLYQDFQRYKQLCYWSYRFYVYDELIKVWNESLQARAKRNGPYLVQNFRRFFTDHWLLGKVGGIGPLGFPARSPEIVIKEGRRIWRQYFARNEAADRAFKKFLARAREHDSTQRPAHLRKTIMSALYAASMIPPQHLSNFFASRLKETDLADKKQFQAAEQARVLDAYEKAVNRAVQRVNSALPEDRRILGVSLFGSFASGVAGPKSDLDTYAISLAPEDDSRWEFFKILQEEWAKTGISNPISPFDAVAPSRRLMEWTFVERYRVFSPYRGVAGALERPGEENISAPASQNFSKLAFWSVTRTLIGTILTIYDARREIKAKLAQLAPKTARQEAIKELP